jgi:DNA (cytosine-5)-methyltransferase 1
MTHIGLFEGIGGFSLAARWAGWHTPVMVEWNPYCQAVLKKNFPNATIFGDIHEFDGRPYAGQFDILTGGFPCQPYSHAGKRAGNDDDRALWPQMFRIIREIKPAWVVGENVAGLLTMDGGHVLRGILTDLENEGYRPEIYSIPALAVGAPHERERIWIVAHSDSNNDSRAEPGRNRKANGLQAFNRQENSPTGMPCGTNNQVCDTTTADPDNQQRHRTRGTWRRWDEFANQNCTTADANHRYSAIPELAQKGRIKNKNAHAAGSNFTTADAGPGRCGQTHHQNDVFGRQSDADEFHWKQHWFEVATRLCRVDDGLPTGVDGTRDLPATTGKKTKGKGHRLEALGNAIVPQVAFEIFKAINNYHP